MFMAKQRAIVHKSITIMKKNIGTTDRIVRIVLGVAILALGYYYETWWGVLGLIPLATGIAGWCGLYSLMGISTEKKG